MKTAIPYMHAVAGIPPNAQCLPLPTEEQMTDPYFIDRAMKLAEMILCTKQYKAPHSYAQTQSSLYSERVARLDKGLTVDPDKLLSLKGAIFNTYKALIPDGLGEYLFNKDIRKFILLVYDQVTVRADSHFVTVTFSFVELLGIVIAHAERLEFPQELLNVLKNVNIELSKIYAKCARVGETMDVHFAFPQGWRNSKQFYKTYVQILSLLDRVRPMSIMPGYDQTCMDIIHQEYLSLFVYGDPVRPSWNLNDVDRIQYGLTLEMVYTYLRYVNNHGGDADNLIAKYIAYCMCDVRIPVKPAKPGVKQKVHFLRNHSTNVFVQKFLTVHCPHASGKKIDYNFDRKTKGNQKLTH